ncbi:hypothetical protein [Methylobacterium nodulans]|uniref:Uncharacterized protein n=1 Tax=Methylobacterium nodulans (strain LMG 21967 / CNCM I-2342 / ORS 2060) TaxID=460265 RepID=B8IHA5_METNO|nr:hypothetical protein [Methylobacterium nodulans]ACL59797.1 conserved hypothetical protein [Methylobacterium nodulans ORS 2060]
MTAPSSSALLAGLFLSAATLATPALAQQAKPGWVDPPSKMEPAARDAATPAQSKPAQPRTAQAPGPKPRHRTAEAASKPRQADRAEPRPTAHRATRVVREEAAHRPVRLAIRPAPRPAPPPAPAETVSDSRLVGWAVAAQDLTRDYFAAFSQPNGVSLGATPRFYAERVVFHGRTMSLGAVLAEKRRFFARWPERRYRARPDSIRTACNAGVATCQVDSTVDFVAANPDRGARSQGTVAVRLGVSFAAGRPMIVSETSRVLSRERVASRID